jgi:hypothetical protein
VRWGRHPSAPDAIRGVPTRGGGVPSALAAFPLCFPAKEREAGQRHSHSSSVLGSFPHPAGGWVSKMVTEEESMRSIVQGLIVGTVCLFSAHAFAQDIDRAVGDTKAYSPYLTFWPSEFMRLRLQYTYLDQPSTAQQAAHEHQVFLQWTAVIGSHVHGFRER